MELLSLIAGSATGFLFRYLAEKRQAEQENFKRLIDMNKMVEDSRKSAIERVPLDDRSDGPVWHYSGSLRPPVLRYTHHRRGQPDPSRGSVWPHTRDEGNHIPDNQWIPIHSRK
jgi:hypothetical protein